MFDSYIPILVGIAIIIGCYFLLQTKYKKQIATMLLFLVAQAEIEFGSKTGELKYSAVSTWIYERIPTTAKLFLSTSTIDMLIEDAVAQLQTYLEDNIHARTVVQDEHKAT